MACTTTSHDGQRRLPFSPPTLLASSLPRIGCLLPLRVVFVRETAVTFVFCPWDRYLLLFSMHVLSCELQLFLSYAVFFQDILQNMSRLCFDFFISFPVFVLFLSYFLLYSLLRCVRTRYATSNFACFTLIDCDATVWFTLCHDLFTEFVCLG